MVLKYFLDDHQLYLGTGRDAKFTDFGLDKLKDICIVPLFLVSQVVIDEGMEL